MKRKFLEGNEIQDYFNKLKQVAEIIQKNYIDAFDHEYMQIYAPSHKTFEEIVDLFGFNSKPKIVSEKEYNKNKSAEIYRGVTDYDYTANLLCDDSYNHGTGYINGIFATEFKDAAEFYTVPPESAGHPQPEKVLSLKLSSKNGIFAIDLHTICEGLRFGRFSDTDDDVKQKLGLIYNFGLSISDPKLKDRFFMTLENDASKLAILLGYDFIRDTKDYLNHTIILNRSIIEVSVPEFNRFCEKSEKYKGFIIPSSSQSEPGSE